MKTAALESKPAWQAEVNRERRYYTTEEKRLIGAEPADEIIRTILSPDFFYNNL
jgi:hypothetical protein